MGEAVVSGLVNGSMYGMLALGIVLVYRGSRVLNFAQVELGTFAAFIAWMLTDERGWPWAAAALVAIAFAVGISALFDWAVVRPMAEAPRLAVAVATIGLLLLLISVEIEVWGVAPKSLRGPIGGTGPEIFGYVVTWTQFAAFATAAGIAFGLNAFLRRTDFGLAVLAAADDPTAVRMVGVRVARVSAFTWITAGVLGAIAVVFTAPTVGAFTPGFFSIGSTALFVPALAASLLGGLASLPRAFAGGLAVGVLEALVRWQTIELNIDVPGTPVVAVFVVIIGVLLVRPAFLNLREAS